ncbi:MAG: OsmC family protein [Chitinophagaceae bacterium]
MKYLLAQPIKANITEELYKVVINWRNGIIICDEPESLGGKDIGPDPYTLLVSSLASCTLSTLRMYINRKQWNINAINIEVNLYQVQGQELTTTFTRIINFEGEVSEEQKQRLLQIANACPISKILKSKIDVITQ